MTAADGAVAVAGTGASKAAATAAGASGTGVKGAEYKETRLQVRLSTGGQPLVKAFNSDAREFLRRSFSCMGLLLVPMLITAES